MKLVAMLLITLSMAASGKTFTVMAYNVENLFDTAHDPGKDDYTYLPLSLKNSSREIQKHCSLISNDYYREQCFTLDWSEKVLSDKIKNISKVIKAFGSGRGPDILIMEEVENMAAIKALVSRGLVGMGYEYLSLIEGPDSRGIDTAVISRYPIVYEKLHLVDLEGVAKETRGILQADVKIGRTLVSVFANHWPSQSNPAEARLIAAETLLRAAQESAGDIVIAAGDFNTEEHDHPHGINQVIRPNFYIANEVATERGNWVFAGTHWYRGEWSHLDKMMILKGRNRGVRALYDTFEVHKKDWMLFKRRWTNYQTGERSIHHVPYRFEIDTGSGYSDHLPLGMAFAY